MRPAHMKPGDHVILWDGRAGVIVSLEEQWVWQYQRRHPIRYAILELDNDGGRTTVQPDMVAWTHPKPPARQEG